MKTTFDLPGELVKQLKLQSVRQGRKLKDLAADLLSAGLAGSVRTSKPTRAQLVPKSLPRLKARAARATGAKKMTGQEFADFIKDVEQQHEIERHERALGHQHVDRAHD